MIQIKLKPRRLCQIQGRGTPVGAGMVELSRLDEYLALAELRQRKRSGVAKTPILPAVMYKLKIQRLVEPDDYGDLQINLRGLQRLRRLLRSGITRKKNWRLGR